MINNEAEYISNKHDQVITNPVNIKKTNKLNTIRNNTSETDFCYSYGIYIVMASFFNGFNSFKHCIVFKCK
jgi:hypothetical protein